MNITRTSQAITGIVIVLCLAAISCSLAAHYYATLSEEAYETRRLMFGHWDRLADGSDQLTNSVRAYAATGDRRHYDVFQRELTVDRTREEAVAGLTRLGLETAELDLLTQAKKSSDALVLIENRAF